MSELSKEHVVLWGMGFKNLKFSTITILWRDKEKIFLLLRKGSVDENALVDFLKSLLSESIHATTRRKNIVKFPFIFRGILRNPRMRREIDKNKEWGALD